LATASPAFGYSYAGEWAELGQSAPVVLSSVRSALESNLRGTADGFFVTPFGGHLHRLPGKLPDSQMPLPGHSGDIYGMLFGTASLQDCGENVSLRYGVAAFAVRSQWNALGYLMSLPPGSYSSYIFEVLPGHRQDQRRVGGVLFGSLHYLAKDNLTGRVSATVGCNYLMNKLVVSHYTPPDRVSTEGFDLFTDLAVVQHMVAIGGLQIGPWAGVSFHRAHLKSFYAQRTVVPHSGTSFPVPAFSFNTVDVSCGISLERAFQGKGKSGSDLAVRAGWKCRAIEENSINTPSTGLANYIYTYTARCRDTVVGSVELTHHFDSHWEILANWSGQFAKDSHSNHCSASLAFHF
jgi:hypothetical protein